MSVPYEGYKSFCYLVHGEQILHKDCLQMKSNRDTLLFPRIGLGKNVPGQQVPQKKILDCTIRHFFNLFFVGLGLLAIVWLNYFIRHKLENAKLPPYPVLNRDALEHPWKLLLPVDMGDAEGPSPNKRGSYHWFTTGQTVVNLCYRFLSRERTYYILNALLILVSFGITWPIFRSLVFSFSVAICMAFSTQFAWLHHCSSIIAFYLYVMYLETTILCLFKSLSSDDRRWKFGYVLSLVILALNHEQWLDYVVFIEVASSLLFAISLLHRNWRLRRTTAFVFSSTNAVAIAYLVIRLRYGNQQYTPGDESEMVFTYNSSVLAAEDIISNVLTYIYLAFSNYFPPCLVSSNSLYRLGSSAIVEQQNGFHQISLHLVPMHHLFYWYFYAGIVFTIFCYSLYRSAIRALRTGVQKDVQLVLLLLIIATGFAIHSVVKYRAYLSAPFLTYKCMTSNVGVAFLISFLLMESWRRFEESWLKYALVLGAWGLILYCGFVRPDFLSHLSSQVQMGTLPSPLKPFITLCKVRH